MLDAISWVSALFAARQIHSRPAFVALLAVLFLFACLDHAHALPRRTRPPVAQVAPLGLLETVCFRLSPWLPPVKPSIGGPAEGELRGMATILFFFSLVLLRGVLAQYTAYNYGFDVSKHFRRQADKPLVVRGDPSGTIRLRLEIRELEQDSDLWTLYILGLSMMQFEDQTDPNSWYGLTGSLHPRGRRLSRD